MNDFQAGNAEQISEVIFYAIICSFDRMSSTLEQRCKDSPTVSTELYLFNP